LKALFFKAPATQLLDYAMAIADGRTCSKVAEACRTPRRWRTKADRPQALRIAAEPQCHQGLNEREKKSL